MYKRQGAQLIVIETMSDTYEIKAALLAAKENSDLPVFATMTFDEQGKLLTGGEIEAAVFLLEGLGADAIGMNCGLGPEQMRALLPRMRACASVPIIAKPNAGLPVDVYKRQLPLCTMRKENGRRFGSKFRKRCWEVK